MRGIQQFCSAPGVYGLLCSKACQSCNPIWMRKESSKHQAVCCSMLNHKLKCLCIVSRLALLMQLSKSSNTLHISFFVYSQVKSPDMPTFVILLCDCGAHSVFRNCKLWGNKIHKDLNHC